VQRKRILIAASDAQTRDELVQAFSTGGFDAMTAPDADSVRFHVVTAKPDLIILDLTMLGTGRSTVLRQIRRFSSAPLLGLMTGYDPERIVDSLDLGADRVMTQPVDLRELAAHVRALLRRSTHVEESRCQAMQRGA
jgi:two-component system KDP operon response regulator KdpE